MAAVSSHASDVRADVTDPHRGLYPSTRPPEIQEAMALGVELADHRRLIRSRGVPGSVSGTPSIFLNGRVISGVQPVESFVHLIQDELTRGQSQEPYDLPSNFFQNSSCSIPLPAWICFPAFCRIR